MKLYISVMSRLKGGYGSPEGVEVRVSPFVLDATAAERVVGGGLGSAVVLGFVLRGGVVHFEEDVEVRVVLVELLADFVEDLLHLVMLVSEGEGGLGDGERLGLLGGLRGSEDLLGAGAKVGVLTLDLAEGEGRTIFLVGLGRLQEELLDLGELDLFAEGVDDFLELGPGLELFVVLFGDGEKELRVRRVGYLLNEANEATGELAELVRA